jgi:putative ATPase
LNQEVPTHLRDAHYKGAARLGHGEGYVYPHDDPSGAVGQQYRPEALEGRVYYEPSPRDRDPEATGTADTADTGETETDRGRESGS